MLSLLKRKHKQGGFTLLELLMVVIIIAILASIALPQYIKATEKARAAEALNALSAIRSAQIRYKALDPGGAYTTVLTALDIEGIGALVSWTGPDLSSGTRAIYTRANTAAETVGIVYDTGVLCGNFTPLALAVTTCP